MVYTHLTLDMRKKLEIRHHSGCSMAAIARELGVSRSTIHREIQRNGEADHYDAVIAHKRAMQRKKRPEGCFQPERKAYSTPFVRLQVVEWKIWKYEERPSRFFKANDLSLRMARQTHNPLSGSPELCRKELNLFEKIEHKNYLLCNRNERNHWQENFRRTERNWKFFIRAPYDRAGRLAHAYWKYLGKNEKPYYPVKRLSLKEGLPKEPFQLKTAHKYVNISEPIRKSLKPVLSPVRSSIPLGVARPARQTRKAPD